MMDEGIVCIASKRRSSRKEDEKSKAAFCVYGEVLYPLFYTAVIIINLS